MAKGLIYFSKTKGSNKSTLGGKTTHFGFVSAARKESGKGFKQPAVVHKKTVCKGVRERVSGKGMGKSLPAKFLESPIKQNKRPEWKPRRKVKVSKLVKRDSPQSSLTAQQAKLLKQLMPKIKHQSLSVKMGGNPDPDQQLANQNNMWVRFKDILDFV